MSAKGSGGKGIRAMLGAAAAHLKQVATRNQEKAMAEGLTPEVFIAAVGANRAIASSIGALVPPPFLVGMVRDSAEHILMAVGISQAKHNAIRLLARMSEGTLDVPTSPAEVMRLMEAEVDPHGREADGHCCVAEFEYLSISTHMNFRDEETGEIRPAPALLELIAAGQTAKAARLAEMFDLSAAVYALSGALIPVCHPDVQPFADMLLSQWQEEDAAAGFNMAQAAETAEGVNVIKANTDADAIARLIESANGVDPRQLPPSVS